MASASRSGAFGILLISSFLPGGRFPAGEDRFDPPLEGACLGLSGQFRSGRFLVQAVERSSAAEKAGISPGDGILRLGGAAGFSGLDDFLRAAHALRRGESVEVEVLRGDRALTLSLVADPSILLDYYQLRSLLRSSRFFRSRAGIDGILEEIDASTPEALRAAARSSGAHDVLNRAVGRLGVSHSAIIPPWAYQNLFAGEGGGGGHGTGMLVEKAEGEEGSYFICEVMDGSPGAAAGAMGGDEVLGVNGVSPASSPRLCLAGYEASRPHYTIQVDPGETFRLELRRVRGGPRIVLEVTADRPVSGIGSSRASVRWLERDGRRIAYIHLWNLLSAELPPVLDRVIAPPGDFAEGLIVDLRGRGGQVAVTERVIRRLQAFRRPLALLIDRETRSAKEVLAFKMKASAGVAIVGERTAGAVLPANIQKLAGETRVMLPADRGGGRPLDADERLIWGELEGKGVSPDIPVERAGRYGAGLDPILEAGIEEVAERLASVPRRRRL